MKRGYVLKCKNCSGSYDLVKATDRSADGNIRCPHCNHVVGKRNS
jgi:predicted Zn finger-like uncharacterized protein